MEINKYLNIVTEYLIFLQFVLFIWNRLIFVIIFYLVFKQHRENNIIYA